MAQLMPLPLTVSCISIIQISFTFLLPADPNKGPLNGCVCYSLIGLLFWVTIGVIMVRITGYDAIGRSVLEQLVALKKAQGHSRLTEFPLFDE